ncbi:MAG: GNAT family N-acetyltransferase [Stackebrandtia sp.]
MSIPPIELTRLPTPVIAALAVGELAAANRLSPVTLPSYFVGPECRSVWRMRSTQIAADPAEAEWVTRAVVAADTGVVVGRGGFHGPPDARGMVELGYAIDPAWRRRGYARACLLELLDWAGREPAVATVRAAVRPDNLASLNLIRDYGFDAVGEQWDDEDGLETIFEAAAKP